MTVAEVRKMYENEYIDIEFYRYNGKRHIISTDTVVSIEDEPSDTETVIDWELMDEYDYDTSILCNSCERADFAMWYDDADAKVLVIIIE